MTSRVTRILLVLGLSSPALAAGEALAAKLYPVNVCVAVKQRAAGTYCKRVLRTLANWERDGDAVRRDARLIRIGGLLASDWAKAEAKSAAQSVDCAATTLSTDALVSLVGSATGAILTAVNENLDLGDPADARCGKKLLQAAGKKCQKLLAAESDYVRKLAADPHEARLSARRGRVSSTFTTEFTKQRRKGCGTAATSGGLGGQVDALVGDVVRQTTVSPNLSDTQFTTVTPTGTTPYEGNRITPVCMEGSPYSFFVKRGSVNKLLMYYQGGGACWEQLTCSIPVCDPNVTQGDNPQNAPVGFFDLANPSNPFRDWNIVFVSYCSCDIHFGDAAQDYPLHVEHRGWHNSRIAEKFAREHFVNPEQIFVTGSSAGAYGAWFNGAVHHQVWPASEFQILADAGNGVITRDFLENEFPNWNFAAHIPDDIPGVQESLVDGTGIPGYTKAVTSYFPETRWAHYTTAFDGGSGGQTGFYNVMLNDNNPAAALTWWGGSCAFNARMREQALATAAAVPSNYRYYIGTGSRHTIWFNNKVYSDTTGGVPVFLDWIGGMLHGTPAWTNVECTDCGKLLPGDPRPPTIPTPPFFQVGPDVKIVCDGGSPSGAFLE
ncbi:MAG: hypothetical protein KIT14_10090 [bacterium]|nr:hypothetical protein [bacterium]